MKGEACEIKEARSSEGEQQEEDIARASGSQWKQVLIENYQEPVTGASETTKPSEGDERSENNSVTTRAEVSTRMHSL